MFHIVSRHHGPSLYCTVLLPGGHRLGQQAQGLQLPRPGRLSLHQGQGETAARGHQGVGRRGGGGGGQVQRQRLPRDRESPCRGGG